MGGAALSSFSLAEFFEFNRVDPSKADPLKVESLQGDFLRNGGYPETVSRRSMSQAYLQMLFDSVIYKDVVRRHKVRNATDLNNVAMFLLSNVTGTFSYNDVAEDLGLSSLVECAGELGCASLTIVTWNEERTIQKDGYTVNVVPVEKFSSCKI